MIQWYPGHMAKTKRELEETMNIIDVVIELVDARCPHASSNPLIKELTTNKKVVTCLMKRDLANEAITKQWLDYFQEKGDVAVAIDVGDRHSIQTLVNTVTEVGLKQQEQQLKKGVKQRAIRALVVGVPNVGKSTLINRLANKRIAKIGDRPGITKHQQWIKVRGKFELLDTPGILWPKFADELIGKKLAAVGSIKYELVPTEDIAAYVIQHIAHSDQQALKERYGVEHSDDMYETFIQIGKRRGALESGGKVNMEKVAQIVLQDFRTGKLGNISLEQPNS